MGFGDLKSSDGQAGLVLNEYLADRSYIEGFQPSQADAVVFAAMSAAPPASLVNALRWYNHIKSYGSDKTSFPGVGKPLDSYGPPGKVSAPAKDDDDDDMDDLFGSSEEEDEAESEERKKRVADYSARKSKKPALVAKSNIILDVKPWEDATDMKEVERLVREVACDGLLWGTSKLVEVGYGIKKLVISCVVEDDKVGTDFLEEEITKFEDLVQSVDIAAFNKI